MNIARFDLGSQFGLGFLFGPQMLVLHVAWWHWRIDWTGALRDHWPATRPFKKGEVPRGALYDLTKHRGLNPHLKAAAKDKYSEHYVSKNEEVVGWRQKLARWLRLSRKA